MSLRFSLDSSETAAAPACFSHFRPPFRLISLHERRSRNMMARIERRELSALSNFIRTVKRPPKTSFKQPFVPQTLPPGRTGGRRGGASMVSLPSVSCGELSGEYGRGQSRTITKAR